MRGKVASGIMLLLTFTLSTLLIAQPAEADPLEDTFKQDLLILANSVPYIEVIYIKSWWHRYATIRINYTNGLSDLDKINMQDYVQQRLESRWYIDSVERNYYPIYGPPPWWLPQWPGFIIGELIVQFKPMATISLDGTRRNDDWFTSDVKATLYATILAEVDRIEYSFDNATWVVYTTPFNLTNEGRTTLYYRSIDNVGIVETWKWEVKIDKTAPAGSIRINDDNAYTKSTSVAINLTAEDATSGVDQMCFSYDNVSWTFWEQYSASKAWTLTIGDGAKTIYVQLQDQAGLISSYSKSIILDITKPTANAGAEQTVYQHMPVTFDGSTSADANGIASYRWVFNDATPQTLSGKKPTYTFNTAGTYTITLNVTDAAGNWATDTIQITVLDITKPIWIIGATVAIIAIAAVALLLWKKRK